MNWMDVDEQEMVNLETIVRAHASEDGLQTVLYTISDSFYIPVQYQTFRAMAKFKKQAEISQSEATNQTLHKILAGQTTMTP